MTDAVLRVGFAGTPEFAAEALAAILAAGHTVPLVLTQPDRPAGRGMKLQPSAVKQCALTHSLPVAQPSSLKLDGRYPDEAAAARTALQAQHRPGVEPGVHLHHGDAGLGVAGLDGAVDRRGAAPARQQRAVDIQAAQAGPAIGVRRLHGVKHPLRQDQPVSGHHQHIELRRLQRLAGGSSLGRITAVELQAGRL